MDIWALGVVYFNLLFGEHNPFHDAANVNKKDIEVMKDRLLGEGKVFKIEEVQFKWNSNIQKAKALSEDSK